MTVHCWLVFRITPHLIHIVIGIGLVGIGGLIESVNMPVVAPYVNCVLDFSTAQQGMLLSASLFGMVCTLHFWGLVADSLGRQKALRASIIGGFSMSLLAVFSCDNCSQIVLRFLTGGLYVLSSKVSFETMHSKSVFDWTLVSVSVNSLAATQSVTLTYIAEFHSTAKAARAAAFVTIFHSSSWLVVSGLSIWIIPMDWVLWFASFPFRPWRLLLLILTLFNLWNSIVFSCLPESPKFSVANNREQEALEGLRMIYAFNTGKPKEVFGPTF